MNVVKYEEEIITMFKHRFVVEMNILKAHQTDGTKLFVKVHQKLD